MTRRRVFKDGEKTLLSVYLDGELYDALFEQAKLNDMAMSTYCRAIFVEHIARKRKISAEARKALAERQGSQVKQPGPSHHPRRIFFYTGKDDLPNK